MTAAPPPRGCRPLLLALTLSLGACGAGPTVPTPEAFPLPAGAPPEAVAGPSTTRVTITTIDAVREDGVAGPLTALQSTSTYLFRVWIFCPRGLEGPVLYVAGYSYLGVVGGSESFPPGTLAPGYNPLLLLSHRWPLVGAGTVTVNLTRDPKDTVVVASKSVPFLVSLP